MDDNAELESFRRKWREEVSQRNRALVTRSPTDQPVIASSGNQRRLLATRLEASSRAEEEFDDRNDSAFDVIVQQTQQLGFHNAEDAQHQNSPSQKPYSALEHFEKAVEKEAEGQLGDSLSHYRMAYRVNTLNSVNCNCPKL
jgi:F-box protein 9